MNDLKYLISKLPGNGPQMAHGLRLDPEVVGFGADDAYNWGGASRSSTSVAGDRKGATIEIVAGCGYGSHGTVLVHLDQNGDVYAARLHYTTCGGHGLWAEYRPGAASEYLRLPGWPRHQGSCGGDWWARTDGLPSERCWGDAPLEGVEAIRARTQSMFPE